jgi:predicted nucleic acid-binding protein
MARPVLAEADVLIDYAAGTGAAAEVERLIAAGRLRLPVVAFYELWRGTESKADRAEMRRMLAGVPVAWLTRHDAEAAAGVWSDLTEHQRGQVGDRDILIAGIALARRWSLLTRNRRHFALTGADLHDEGE